MLALDYLHIPHQPQSIPDPTFWDIFGNILSSEPISLILRNLNKVEGVPPHILSRLKFLSITDTENYTNHCISIHKVILFYTGIIMFYLVKKETRKCNLQYAIMNAIIHIIYLLHHKPT